MPTWADVCAFAVRFPEVEEAPWYGTPGLKVRGTGFARLRTDPDALMLGVADLGEKEALLQSDPDAFFTIAHYDGYAAILVRLEHVDAQELQELIEDAWRRAAPKRLVAEYDATA